MKHDFNVNGVTIELTFTRIKDSRVVDGIGGYANINWFKIDSAMICTIRTSNPSLLSDGQGISLCSRKDEFDWRRGRKESLTKALRGRDSWARGYREELWEQVIALPEKEWRR